MDKATLGGVGAGLALIYGAIFLGSGWITFFDIPSLLLVLGGTCAGMLVTFSLDELKQVPKGFKEFLSFQPPELGSYVGVFGELSRVARREGLLALDRRLEETEDPFLRFGLELAVDGIDETEINDLLQSSIQTETRQEMMMARFFTAAGTSAPSFGMIGTLIGLIQMMGNLSDPSQIGAGMAVALVTTFYGSLVANLFFLPFATKKRAQINELLQARELVCTGVMGIVRGDSPSMIQKRLQLYLGESAEEGEAAPAVEVS